MGDVAHSQQRAGTHLFTQNSHAIYPQQTTSGKVTDWVLPSDKSGEFKRQVSSFREWISKEPGARFPPEKDRYHLYISYACPWVRLFLSLPDRPDQVVF